MEPSLSITGNSLQAINGLLLKKEKTIDGHLSARLQTPSMVEQAIASFFITSWPLTFSFSFINGQQLVRMMNENESACSRPSRPPFSFIGADIPFVSWHIRKRKSQETDERNDVRHRMKENAHAIKWKRKFCGPFFPYYLGPPRELSFFHLRVRERPRLLFFYLHLRIVGLSFYY